MAAPSTKVLEAIADQSPDAVAMETDADDPEQQQQDVEHGKIVLQVPREPVRKRRATTKATTKATPKATTKADPLMDQRVKWQAAKAGIAHQMCGSKCKPTAPDCLEEDENGLPKKFQPCVLFGYSADECLVHYKVSLPALALAEVDWRVSCSFVHSLCLCWFCHTSPSSPGLRRQ